jgi:DNA-binding NtrC family response regulator
MEESDHAVPTATMSKGRILFVDDDKPFRDSVGKCLIRAGFACDYAGSAAEAIELMQKHEFDALISDINMPGLSGLELIEHLPAANEGLPVILLTGDPTVETAIRSVRLRVVAYLTKPTDIDELCVLVARAVAERQSVRTLKDSRQRLQDWDREIERLLQLLNASSGMFWEFFIGRDKGLIPRSGRRYRS